MNIQPVCFPPNACEVAKCEANSDRYEQLIAMERFRLAFPMRSTERAELLQKIEQLERALASYRSGRPAWVYAFFRHLHAWIGVEG
jgi:hypothetical protein